jgi:hypothetical protein
MMARIGTVLIAYFGLLLPRGIVVIEVIEILQRFIAISPTIVDV